jgi:hypothetical protein
VPCLSLKRVPPHLVTAQHPHAYSLATSTEHSATSALLHACMRYLFSNCLSSAGRKSKFTLVKVSDSLGCLFRCLRCTARPACPRAQCRSLQGRACAGTTAPASGARPLQCVAAQHPLVFIACHSWQKPNSSNHGWLTESFLVLG